jgi:hypothetical protein
MTGMKAYTLWLCLGLAGGVIVGVAAGALRLLARLAFE